MTFTLALVFDPAIAVGGFYDPRTATLHLAGDDPLAYAHEIAHAIDGPKSQITGGHVWQEAYKMERDNLDDPDASSNADEWWASLMGFAMVFPDGWKQIRGHVPQSAQVIEDYLYG